jgi:L-fuculose-phosphate aldolase
VLEWRCRQAWHVEAIGGGVPVRDEVFKRFAAPFDVVSFPGLFDAMARRELRADPSILD